MRLHCVVCKDKDRVEKDAEILSRYHKKEEGEVEAEPSITAIPIPASPKEEKASNRDTLSPKHDIVCVSLSPVKVEKKRKDRENRESPIQTASSRRVRGHLLHPLQR